MPESESEYFNLNEIAKAMRMSPRWVRGELDPKAGKNIAHDRPGGRIRMTAEQIEKFRAAYTVESIPQSITTGRRKKSA